MSAIEGRLFGGETILGQKISPPIFAEDIVSEIPQLPLPISGKAVRGVIGESHFRQVYDVGDNVIKVLKPPYNEGMDDQDQVIGKLRGIVEDQTSVRAMLLEKGSKPDVFPESVPFIHRTPDQRYITASWFQRKIESPRILKSVPTDELSRSVLRDMRNLFEANIELAESGRFLDLAGSRGEQKQSPLRRLAKQLFPLRYSENIVLDENNQVVLVDVEVGHTSDGEKPKFPNQEWFQLVGSKIALRMVNRGLNNGHD